MSRLFKRLIVPAAIVLGTCASVFADDKGTTAEPVSTDPLLNLLIQKGYVTAEEARKVKAEAFGSQTNSAGLPPSKWSFGKDIKKAEIFGDLRLRYERRNAHTPTDASVEADRFRYAARIGVHGDLIGGFNFGLRLETGANPRSPWVTFGTSTSGVPYQGPSGKSTASINVGQIYLGWSHSNDVSLIVGKMPNPLYVTPMVWDGDINPEGAAEKFGYTVGQAEFFANFGQFIYQDVTPSRADGFIVPSLPFGRSQMDAFLMAWQAGVNYHVDPDISFKFAGTVYNYVSHGTDNAPGSFPLTPGFSDTFVGEGAGVPVEGTSGFPSGPANGFAFNQTGINDLLIVDFPFEVNFRIAQYRAKVFGDFAQNLDGAARARDAVAAAKFSNPAITLNLPLQKFEDKAYQVGMALSNGDNLGLAYGGQPHRGNWETRVYWQHVEQYALDPNLMDSDFFEGRGNLQGLYAAIAYSLTDSITSTLRFGQAWRINDKLGTGGANQDLPWVNPIKTYQIMQADLSYKF